MTTRMTTIDRHGNRVAREGVDRCPCGCKYWEHDRCVDCGAEVELTIRTADGHEIRPPAYTPVHDWDCGTHHGLSIWQCRCDACAEDRAVARREGES